MKRAKWLRQVEILGSLSERQLALLAGVLQAVTFGDQEMIIRQGDVGDTFYIVEEGIVSCRIEGPASAHSRDAEGSEVCVRCLALLLLSRCVLTASLTHHVLV